MSDQAATEEDGPGKVSIGEALEAIRSGKQIAVPQKALSAKPARRMGKATAAFWVRNLQESVQRRMDMLYDTIRDDPGAMAQMKRRDFFSSERFAIPLDAITGVVEVSPGEPPPPPRPLATFSDLDGVDPKSTSLDQVSKSGEVRTRALAEGEFADRHQQLEKLDLSGHLQTPSAPPPPPAQGGDRFAPSSTFETGRWIIEEIRAAPKTRGKKLKVNPLIRKMFEKRGEEE